MSATIYNKVTFVHFWSQIQHRGVNFEDLRVNHISQLRMFSYLCPFWGFLNTLKDIPTF